MLYIENRIVMDLLIEVNGKYEWFYLSVSFVHNLLVFE